LALVPALLLSHAALAQTASDDQLLNESRSLAQSFGSQLQSALKAAMASGGPVAALSVCKDEAPLIASRLARESGASVSRTSRRYRNPGNAPEPWERAVLESFDSAVQEQQSPPEHLERDANGARYMRAIKTQPVCLACHGSDLSADVQAALAEHYPHDHARGYALGDLRGAFSITWPAPASGEDAEEETDPGD